MNRTLSPDKKVPFIQEKVHQEWLHANLTELEASCLPSGLGEQTSTTIVGHFTLQVNSIRDISEPAYAQLLKVDGTDSENTDVTATQTQTQTQRRSEKADRMLLLELTDGTTVVEGMEYQPIPTLSINLNPGTKVRVFGTIKVRRGILFLTPHNISVLGGKVMDLLETNDRRNTLIKAINNRDQSDVFEEPQIYSNTRTQPSNSGGGGSTLHSAPPDDDEADFFDDDIFDAEFDQDLALEDEMNQDEAVGREPNEGLSLESEFDEDLDQFMSQM